MEGFSISFSDLWQRVVSYFTEIAYNPFRFVTMVLDVCIVIFVLYKFVKSARHSRVWQLLKGIVLIVLITIFLHLLCHMV